MAYQAHAVVRHYDSSTDTCTVELVGVGIIDYWLDGVKPDMATNRALLAGGTPCIVSLPDPTRLCDATLTTVAQGVAVASAQTQTNGRGNGFANGVGQLSVTIPYGYTYAAAPGVLYVAADNGVTASITARTTSNFSVTFSGAPANSIISYTWTALGI